MDRVAFSVSAEEAPQLEAPPELEESPNAWQFASWCVEERFRIALAVRNGGGERRVKLRRWRSAYPDSILPAGRSAPTSPT